VRHGGPKGPRSFSLSELLPGRAKSARDGVDSQQERRQQCGGRGAIVRASGVSPFAQQSDLLSVQDAKGSFRICTVAWMFGRRSAPRAQRGIRILSGFIGKKITFADVKAGKPSIFRAMARLQRWARSGP